MPLFGLAVDYWVTPRWLLIANGQYFALSLSDKVSDYSGALTNLRAATEYVPYAGLGLGIAYNWFAMDVDVNGPDWKGRLDYQYKRPPDIRDLSIQVAEQTIRVAVADGTDAQGT